MSIQPIDPLGQSQPARKPSVAGRSGADFGDVLRSRIDGVSFSGHALERLQRRNISVDGPVAARLTAAVDKAAAKGVRESLVLVDDTAFVVSIKNRTVVTAVDRDHMKEHVFTNIDGAVIA